ncbi:MAG: helix-turn-helix transcriptional regulator [Gemmatimonadota bacterium]|nr:MAG: helix-turn-helix transcriptional regulator [Gemmatimonadota bacterium]
MTEPATVDLQKALPLKPQWFHILLALSQDAQHGSGIVRSVLDQTGGKLRLWPATLYGSLEELAQLGWIEELTRPGERPEGESEKKRFFRLTHAGKQILSAEAGRLKSLAQTAFERLASRGPAA